MYTNKRGLKEDLKIFTLAYFRQIGFAIKCVLIYLAVVVVGACVGGLLLLASTSSEGRVKKNLGYVDYRGTWVSEEQVQKWEEEKEGEADRLELQAD